MRHQKIVKALQEKDEEGECMIRDETNHFTYHSCLCEYQMFRLSNQNFCCLQM